MDVGRADRLMCVLCAVLGLEHARLARIVGLAEAAEDILSRRIRRFRRQTQGVGSHIGDQTGQSVLTQLDSFVQLLRGGHRALGHHVQLARRLLLQGRGGKRRRRTLFLLSLLDAADGKRLSGDRLDDRHRLLLVLELDLSVCVSVEIRGERTAVRRHQMRVQRPVFLRDKRADLLLAVNHHAGCDRLNTSGGQTAPNLLPQERRQLIADQTVEDAARLLGVDQIRIDVSRMGDSLLHRLFRDLVEGHALGALIAEIQQLLEMPRDRLALAVRVGCEIDKVALVRRLAQLVDNLVLPLDRDIFRAEIVLNVDSHGFSRQITQMSHGSLDHVIRAQILPDCFCLCRGLHNDKL